MLLNVTSLVTKCRKPIAQKRILAERCRIGHSPGPKSEKSPIPGGEWRDFLCEALRLDVFLDIKKDCTVDVMELRKRIRFEC